MKLHKILFSLTLAFLVAANCMAQDETKTSSPKAKKATERAIKSTTDQMMKAFEKANLTDEQKEKAQAIIAKQVPMLMAARDAQDNLLTDEQKAKRKDALAKAKEEGMKGPKAAAAAMTAMGLTKEQMEKYEAAKQKVTAATAKIKDAITALLTDEQKASLPAPKGKKAGGKAETKAGKAGKGKKKEKADDDDNDN